MQQMQLWIFWAIVGAFIVCGCVLTRKPTKKPPTETLRKAQSIVEDVISDLIVGERRRGLEVPQHVEARDQTMR